MHWFRELYSLAAVFMLIGLFWRLAVIPLSLIVILFNEKIHAFLMVFVMLIPYYLMASYAVLVGIGINGGEKVISTLVIGGLFLLFTGLLGIAEAQREAEKQNDYAAYRIANYRYICLLIGLIYYVYAIFDMRPTINWLTKWLFNVMQWIQDIPIIGWLVGISALLYVLYMLFVVILMIIGIIGEILQKKSTEI